MSAARSHQHVAHHLRVANATPRNALATVRPSVLAVARLLVLPFASAAPLGLWGHDRSHVLGDDDLPKSPTDPNLWIYLAIAVALVLLGGVFAGLTIALMGQDETYMQVIATSGEGSERRHAQKVLNLLNKGKHWVLVTLLLSNVITNETLPIVLDRSLGGGWPAVVSSTVLIVIFGEIAPQSVCVRYGLSIGAFMAPFVLLLMYIMCPVAWPTAKLLDYLLGEDHGTMYKKAGLKTLVTLHKTLGAGAGEQLMEDEVTIINSVLDLKEKLVGDIMTPMQDVFTMSADTILDERMMDTILSQGYSRIPIYAPENPRNFIGMLLVKILITYDPEDCQRVRDFALATLPETAPHTSCLDIINFFQEGKSHMVMVSDFPGQDKGALGVVTLEDVIEELIGEEIIDESDVFIDVHKALRRSAPAPRTRFNGKHFATDYIDDLDDKSTEPTENEPLLGKRSESESRKTSTTNGQTTFLMRRKSSAASESAREAAKKGTVPVRSSATDLKQHLKHLGPSNAASHPRSTKFSNVKIKPGVGTIPENRATSIVDQDPHTSQQDGTTNLAEVGHRGASGGAAAVYGTIGTPKLGARALSAGEGSINMSAQEASEVARENASRPNTAEAKHAGRLTSEPEPLQLPDKLVVGDAPEDTAENDTVSEMVRTSGSTDRPRKRVSARSGSITETTVDTNGLKKVVLEMTSSSEDADGENVSPGTDPSVGRSPFFGFGRRKSDDTNKTVDNDKPSEGDGVDGKDSTTNGEGEGADSGKKKRKKRGKRKKGGE